MKIGVIDTSLFMNKLLETKGKWWHGEYQPGGGVTHGKEVLYRLNKEFDLTIIPSFEVLELSNQELLMRIADDLAREGFIIDENFWYVLESDYLYKIRKANILLKQHELVRLLYKDYYRLDNYNFLFDFSYSTPDIFYASIFYKKPYVVTLHNPLWYEDSISYFNRLIKIFKFKKGAFIRFFYNELYRKRKIKPLIKRNPPKLLLSVSEGNLMENGLRGKVLKPSNAFDRKLLKLRNKGKEDYAVFYGRLVTEKGILDLLEILREINKRFKNTKLVLSGAFSKRFDYPIYEKMFWKKAKEYKLNIEYLGYVDDWLKLHEIVSRAKVLIYPSHYDSFSLVILESIAVGVPVVAYNIPGPYSVFNGLPGIIFVPEFNIRKMAEYSIKFLNMSESKIADLMNEDKLIEFLNLHSSWDNVAESYKRFLVDVTK